MTNKLSIVAATQYDNAAWQLKTPMPKLEMVSLEGGGVTYRQTGHIQGTRIERIILLDGSVEVFVRAEPKRCFRVTLCKPTVSVLTSLGDQATWEEAQRELDDRETIEEVVDLTDKIWRLNSDVPGQDDFTIVRIGQIGDSAEVFAVPKPGTKFDGLFLHFRLLSFFVKQVLAASEMHNWTQIQTEYAQLAVEEDEPEEEPEEDEEEEDEVLETAPGFPHAPPPPPQIPVAAPPAPTLPNGAATQMTPSNET